MSSVPAFPVSHPLHYLPKGAECVLDVGCNVGATLEAARQLGARRLLGVEINAAAIEKARQRLGSGGEVELVHGSADELPFASGSADVAFCLEVLEHVPPALRPQAVREIHRVLKPGAPLVLTVPYAGLFAWMDPANVRFVFPKAYAAASRLVGGRGREAGFEGEKHGVERHHHFQREELEALLRPHFRFEQLRFRGAFVAPAAAWLEWPFYRRFQNSPRVLEALQWMEHQDYARSWGSRLAYNVLVVARRS